MGYICILGKRHECLALGQFWGASATASERAHLAHSRPEPKEGRKEGRKEGMEGGREKEKVDGGTTPCARSKVKRR